MYRGSGDFMNQFRIVFGSIQEIEQFVRITTGLRGDVSVVSGDQFQDGKAILGLLSLGLHRPLQVAYTGTNEEFDVFFQSVAPFCA